MIIKKYEAPTEELAVQKAHDEFGEDALILKVQTKKPSGLFSFFRKSVVEITAACKEQDPEEKSRADLFAAILEKADAPVREQERADTPPSGYDSSVEEGQRGKIEELQSRLNDTEELLSKVTSRLTIAQRQLVKSGRKYDNTVLQLFYDTLVSQGVAEHIAEGILSEACEQANANEININLMVKIVYNTIISILGIPEEPFKRKTAKQNAKLYAFIGPTGVGKTTTIAKLASILILKKSLNLALVTADTYRIAAVEQLRTYADILGMNVDAVYKSEDLPSAINKNKKVNDVIFLDTAGRSHKNAENMAELSDLLSKIPGCDKFLVLSLTTKYEALVDIVEHYSEFTDFDLIFTKADEADELGSILNICYLTGKKTAYIATGQNVPDDIEIAKPEKIAKSLLGLGGDAF